MRLLLKLLAIVGVIWGMVHSVGSLGTLFHRGEQVDLRTYYFAEKIFGEGGNPYSLTELAQLTHDVAHPFVYPPQTLILLRPLILLPWEATYWIYLGAKLVAIVFLVLLWARLFPEVALERLVLSATLLLAYRSAILRDVRSGNISVFEQVFLWLGVTLALRGMPLRSSICIGLSSALKQTTALLLPLVAFLNRTGRGLFSVALTLAGLCAVHVTAYRTNPALFRGFQMNLAWLDERGAINPSSLALARDLADQWGIRNHWAPLAAWGLWSVIIVALVVYLICSRRFAPEPKVAVVLAMLAYTVVVPRMKDYSYVMTIMPAAYVIQGAAKPAAQIMLYLALWSAILSYQPLLVTIVLLMMQVRRVVRTRNVVPAEKRGAVGVPETG